MVSGERGLEKARILADWFACGNEKNLSIDRQSLIAKRMLARS
jgi:hypothetical protein